jgi:hypothetical protein
VAEGGGEMTPYEGKPIYGADDAIIAVGFGMAALFVDGVPVYEEDNFTESWDDHMTFAQAKDLCKKHRDKVCEIHLVGPLSENYFRLTKKGRGYVWKLFATGRGFA